MLSFIVGCNDGNKKNTPINVYELDWTITEPAADGIFLRVIFQICKYLWHPHFCYFCYCDNKINHRCQCLAQYIDNDEDGTPDNQAVLDSLIKYHPSLVMFATENQAEQFF
jgi:hypothetical protein